MLYMSRAVLYIVHSFTTWWDTSYMSSCHGIFIIRILIFVHKHKKIKNKTIIFDKFFITIIYRKSEHLSTFPTFEYTSSVEFYENHWFENRTKQHISFLVVIWSLCPFSSTCYLLSYQAKDISVRMLIILHKCENVLVSHGITQSTMSVYQNISKQMSIHFLDFFSSWFIIVKW